MREEGANEDDDQDEPEWTYMTPPCLLCQKGRESSAYPGTCDKCGIAYPLGDGDEAKVLQWLQQAARQMRCPDCGEQSIAKMPGGQYQCYRCEPRKTEEHQRPRGKMLGDFLTCESCGSARVAYTTQQVVCLSCDSALGGTLADFMRAAKLDVYEGFDGKLGQFIRTTASVYSDKPEVVGQIMTRNVRVAGVQRRLVELLPLFDSTSHHHIPIIGEGERLVGMITQSDLVAALGRAADPAA